MQNSGFDPSEKTLISQIGTSSQVGVKIKNVRNLHLDTYTILIDPVLGIGSLAGNPYFWKLKDIPGSFIVKIEAHLVVQGIA